MNTTLDRRRADDAAAHLEGRMDVMEEKLAHLDEKIDAVDGKVDETLRTLKGIEKYLHRIELEGKERDGKLALIEQRVKATEDSGASKTEDGDLSKWRRRFIDAFVVAVCIVGILYLLTDMHDKLSPDAQKAAQQLGVLKP